MITSASRLGFQLGGQLWVTGSRQPQGVDANHTAIPTKMRSHQIAPAVMAFLQNPLQLHKPRGKEWSRGAAAQNFLPQREQIHSAAPDRARFYLWFISVKGR